MATQILERRTVTLEEAAKLIGCGRSTIYEEATRTGAIIGVPVLRVGRRKVLSRAHLERALNGELESKPTAA